MREVKKRDRNRGHLYGDLRLERTYEELGSNLAARQSCVIHQVGSSYAQQRSYYRFMSNGRTSEGAISKSICQLNAQVIAGAHVLSLSDTTDVDYSWCKDRIGLESGLGYIGDHRGWGYQAHVHLNVLAQTGSVVGLSDVKRGIAGKRKRRGQATKRRWKTRSLTAGSKAANAPKACWQQPGG